MAEESSGYKCKGLGQSGVLELGANEGMEGVFTEALLLEEGQMAETAAGGRQKEDRSSQDMV